MNSGCDTRAFAAGITLLTLIALAQAQTTRSAAHEPGDLPQQTSVSQYGITWTFDRPVPVWGFFTGDFYVIGPVTVIGTDPAPEGEGKEFRNGSMLNPPTTTAVGYDGRIRGFEQELAATFPLQLKPGDSLVTVISGERMQNQVLPNPTKSLETGSVKTAAVLTCLAELVSQDAFRPSYCDLEKSRIRLARDIRWDLLPKIEPVKSEMPFGWVGRGGLDDAFTSDGLPTWPWVERMFERPWIDHCYGWHSRELHPLENMPGYGREIGRAVSYAALLLALDVPREQKEKLALRLIQVGIDNWGVATRSVKGSAGGWPAAGGFGNGRKLPIVFAAMMLNDEEMLQIRKHAGEASFGEDEHVELGPSWTGAAVRFTGQYPLIGDRAIDRGPYEHLPPDQWPGEKKTMSEGYRRCCTSISWVGQALVMRMMKAEKVWDHDAFFVYVDRWMYEDDTPYLARIQEVYPDFKTIRQGTTEFDPWIEAMWVAYRTMPGMPPADAWKTSK